MSKVDQLLATIEPELLDRLVPLTTLGSAVVPELLGARVSRSRVYLWPDNGLETISTNGDGTGQLFTTRRWVIEFWTGEKSGLTERTNLSQGLRDLTTRKSSGGVR